MEKKIEKTGLYVLSRTYTLFEFIKYILVRLVGTLRLHPYRSFLLLFLLGAFFITVNTLYLFITRPLHGDIVAQQLIVSQWMNGTQPLEARLGPTNYILKFPIYAFIEGSFGWINPFTRLIGTTILLNILGWLAILFFSFKTANLTRLTYNQKFMLGLGLLYIAIISSSVFWLNYPNSRNIEIGLMLGVLYWTLRLLLKPFEFTWRRLFELGLYSIILGIIFFNDKYGLYVVALPLLIYVAILLVNALKNKMEPSIIGRYFITGVALSTSLCVYYAISKLITKFTPISIIPSADNGIILPTTEELMTNISNTFFGILKTLGIDLFGLSVKDGMVKVLFYVMCIIILGLSFYFIKGHRELRNDPSKSLSKYAYIAIIISTPVVAVVSSQTAQRYMIIFAFIALLLVVTITNFKRRHAALAISVLGVLILLHVAAFIPVTLKGVMNREWRNVNNETYSIINAARSSGTPKGYISLQYAQPISYLSGLAVTGIPLRCNDEGDEAKQGLPIKGIAHGLLIEKSTLLKTAPKTFVYVGKNGTCLNESLNRTKVTDQVGISKYSIVKTSTGSTLIVYDRDVRPELSGY